MRDLITSPEKFANRFNQSVPGAYRKISGADVKLMKECELIGKDGCYWRADIEMIRRIMLYEQMRDKATVKQERETTGQEYHCRICGEPLPIPEENKAGRPREYCFLCEPARSTWRNRKWRNKVKYKDYDFCSN